MKLNKKKVSFLISGKGSNLFQILLNNFKKEYFYTVSIISNNLISDEIKKFIKVNRLKIKLFEKKSNLKSNYLKGSDVIFSVGYNRSLAPWTNFMINKIPIDINVSWLNPEKVRKITIITDKQMILFDEMNIDRPIQIFNNYANYPKLSKFTKSYFSQKAFVYKGRSKKIKLNVKNSLDNEILDFLNDRKNISNINFAEEIIRISKKIID